MAKTPILIVATILAALSLSGCGFTPLYATDPAGQRSGSLLGPVEINEISGKSGHVLRAELGKLLQTERSAGPVRVLKITLTEASAGLGYRLDESASRSDLSMTATYTLTENDMPIASGAVSAVASYDAPASAFGELAALDDARERGAENLARTLFTRLNLQLSQRKNRPAVPVTTVPASTVGAPVTPAN